MTAFIVRRIIQTIITVLIVSFISFSLIQLIPGDPATIMLGETGSPEQIEALRKELWLDKPIPVQYFHWMDNILHGDLGDSITYGRPVVDVLLKRLPPTAYLVTISSVLSAILGILAGIFCAVKRGSVLDNIISVFANFGIAVPIFWLGVVGVYFIGLKLGWLPVQGYTSPLTDFSKSTARAVMPVICMGIPFISILARQTRSSMLEVIRQDYIRTAMSKGIKQRVVVMKHALKNAIIPVVTLLGLQIRMVVGGSALIETVFNIPGMGKLIVEAVYAKDFTVVQGSTLLMAIVVCLVNLLVDISYGWLDPRIKYE